MSNRKRPRTESGDDASGIKSNKKKTKQKPEKYQKKKPEIPRPDCWREIVRFIDQLKATSPIVWHSTFFTRNAQKIDAAFNLGTMFTDATEQCNDMRWERWSYQLNIEETTGKQAPKAKKDKAYKGHMELASRIGTQLFTTKNPPNNDAVRDVYRTISEITNDETFMLHYPKLVGIDTKWNTFVHRNHKQWYSTKVIFNETIHTDNPQCQCANTVYCSMYIKQVLYLDLLSLFISYISSYRSAKHVS